MDINNLCPKCMKEINKEKAETTEKCPHCGHFFSDSKVIQHQLKPFTILAGKYLVGEVLGEGGFGITYIGLDLNLEIRVAIKEFYPNGFVTRESQSTSALTIYTGKNTEVIHKWRDNFIKEARSLAKCSHLSGVVGVKEFFQENNTAYIVQEYLEGETLKEYIKKNGGKVSAEWLLPELKPVMAALGEVHKEGLIHRDISPDNIMLLNSGQMKLLDFGAARDFTQEGEKSLSVMLKPGYAPEEQYRSKGKQGPWSDVYAFAGTIYKCITGVTPPESMERLRKDELKKPSELGIDIAPEVENALIKALEVFAENRYQTIKAFEDALIKKPNVATTEIKKEIVPEETRKDIVKSEDEEEKNKPKKLFKNPQVLGAVGIVLLIFLGVFVWGEKEENNKSNEIRREEITENSIAEENVVKKSEESSFEAVEFENEYQYFDEAEAVQEEDNELGYYEIHRYELIIADVTWEEAYEECKNRGGYLVHINSIEEFDTIAEQIRQEEKTEYTFWLGAMYEYAEDTYNWVDQDGVASLENISRNDKYASFWLPGEPSIYGADGQGNMIHEEYVDMIYRESEDRFYWNDVPNDIISVASYLSGKIGYICEYED